MTTSRRPGRTATILAISTLTIGAVAAAATVAFSTSGNAPTAARAGDVITLSSAKSGLCADIAQHALLPGTTVIRKACDTSSPFQKWQVGVRGTSITLKNSGNGLCLVVPNTMPNTVLSVTTCARRSGQSFAEVRQGSRFQLLNDHSKLCVSDAAQGVASGGAISQQECTPARPQLWTLVIRTASSAPSPTLPS